MALKYLVSLKGFEDLYITQSEVNMSPYIGKEIYPIRLGK